MQSGILGDKKRTLFLRDVMVRGQKAPGKSELAIPWQRVEAARECEFDGHVTKNDLAALNLNSFIVGGSKLTAWGHA